MYNMSNIWSGDRKIDKTTRAVHFATVLKKPKRTSQLGLTGILYSVRDPEIRFFDGSAFSGNNRLKIENTGPPHNALAQRLVASPSRTPHSCKPVTSPGPQGLQALLTAVSACRRPTTSMEHRAAAWASASASAPTPPPLPSRLPPSNSNRPAVVAAPSQ